ncbi:MAG: L-2-hydroxyglutarate oxidase [Acidimicrobiia bacterium]|nr:L-2-hydroxyglutarate oxidase [Acidimicrobiia bacterium]
MRSNVSTNDRTVLVVGGGIVGLSVALALTERAPDVAVVVVDKETRLAHHQTGRNSGVLHSGLYYPPGSLKARLAVDGRAQMVEFCRHHGIAHEVCGKVVVATRPDEIPALEVLHERGLANGVPNERIGPEALRELEPNAAGLAALHVPSTGIVDYVAVCDTMARLVEKAGGTIRLGTLVESVDATGGALRVRTDSGDLGADLVVNCGGLQSDRVARASGTDPHVQIVPFRGEYYEVVPERRDIVRNLIYPVPDPSFPFLGVHLTRMVGGGLEVGPNAVLALAREGYRWRDVDLADLSEVLRYSGFRHLARKYWRTGVGEMWRSASKRAFLRALQRLVPSLQADDLTRAPSGVRAQALRPDGALVDDFAIVEDRLCVHVLNAPSPAATASLPIGHVVVDHLERHLQ